MGRNAFAPAQAANYARLPKLRTQVAIATCFLASHLKLRVEYSRQKLRPPQFELEPVAYRLGTRDCEEISIDENLKQTTRRSLSKRGLVRSNFLLLCWRFRFVLFLFKLVLVLFRTG